jgi:hypothetical protein
MLFRSPGLIMIVPGGGAGGRPWRGRPHGGGSAGIQGPSQDEGVAVGGTFDSDAATGMMPIAHRVAGVLTFPRS